MVTTTGWLRITSMLKSFVPGRAAATATTNFALGRQPHTPGGRAGTVTAVRYIPNAAIVGADTDSLTLSLINKGTDGTGTTVVATLALNAAAGTKDAFVPFALTLSGTAANLDVASGDVLALSSIKVGTGLADPGGMVEVDVKRA